MLNTITDKGNLLTIQRLNNNSSYSQHQKNSKKNCCLLLGAPIKYKEAETQKAAIVLYDASKITPEIENYRLPEVYAPFPNLFL